MGGETQVVPEFCVRSHLFTAAFLCPRFRRSHQRGTDALSPVFREYEPAFDISHVIRTAVFNERAYARFEKPHDAAFFVLGDEYEL